jgi:hypothetical protein
MRRWLSGFILEVLRLRLGGWATHEESVSLAFAQDDGFLYKPLTRLGNRAARDRRWACAGYCLNPKHTENRRDGRCWGRQAGAMKWRLRGAGLAVAWLGLGLGPLAAAPNQMVPKGLARAVTASDLFSFQPPAGWKQEETSGDLQMRGPVSNNFVPDMTANGGNHGKLENLADIYQPELYDNNAPLKIVNKSDFTTAAGVKGLRAEEVSADGKVTQYSYLFINPDGQLVELACACATVDAKVYLPVFDASAKTIVFVQE